MRWALALGLAALSAGPASGQTELEAAAAAFANAWRSADADALAGMLVPDGIRLTIAGESHMGLPVRQARAALSEFLTPRTTDRMYDGGVRESGGDPPMGSAEYRWQTVVEGTSEPIVLTIFVGFQRAGSTWRVTEIRVF